MLTSLLLPFSSKKVKWVDVSRATWAQYAAYCHLRLFMKTDASPVRLDGFSKAQYAGTNLNLSAELLSCPSASTRCISKLACYLGQVFANLHTCRPKEWGCFLSVVPKTFPCSGTRCDVLRSRQTSRNFCLSGTLVCRKNLLTRGVATMETSRFWTTS